MNHKEAIIETPTKKDKDKKGSKGFTLVELVVVIGIIAILAAFAYPKFLDIKKNAQMSAFENDKSEAEKTTELILSGENKLGINDYTKAGTAVAADFAINSTTNRIPLPATLSGLKIKIPGSGESKEPFFLVPITDAHIAVKSREGLKRAPVNPFKDDKYKDYVWVYDFTVSKTISKLPDGTEVQDSVVSPVARLMKREGNELIRNDYIIVEGKNIIRTSVPSEVALIKDKNLKANEKVYGYNFLSGESGANNTEAPDATSPFAP